MKTDARVRYTRKVLRDALFECLKKKPLKEVSVKEVCDLAELNRATFYKHYRDCFDLIEKIEEEQLEEFRELMQTRDKFGKDLTVAILEMLDRNKDLTDAVISGNITDSFKNHMLEAAHEYCIADWKSMMPKATDQEVEMMFSASMAAAFHLVINERDKYDRDSVVSFIHNMINTGIGMYA